MTSSTTLPVLSVDTHGKGGRAPTTDFRCGIPPPHCFNCSSQTKQQKIQTSPSWCGSRAGNGAQRTVRRALAQVLLREMV